MEGWGEGGRNTSLNPPQELEGWDGRITSLSPPRELEGLGWAHSYGSPPPPYELEYVTEVVGWAHL